MKEKKKYGNGDAVICVDGADEYLGVVLEDLGDDVYEVNFVDNNGQRDTWEFHADDLREAL
ncbi:MAG: hypothetical protein OXI43_13905 [Candidatus Poribacteria bacterium]|nr:hypothetical protein [Candidatus Poribacteria bacterium]